MEKSAQWSAKAGSAAPSNPFPVCNPINSHSICLPMTMHDVSTILVDDTDYSCAILMAHYFHHLTLVNFQVFICIAIVYTRCTNDNTNNHWKDYWVCGDADKRGILSSFLVSIYLIANWLCIRYGTHPISFNLLLHNISFLIDPINFLCSFISPGKENNILAFVTLITITNCRT